MDINSASGRRKEHQLHGFVGRIPRINALKSLRPEIAVVFKCLWWGGGGALRGNGPEASAGNASTVKA